MEFQAKKIKREKPNRKWTEEDIKKLLNFLQEAPEVEAPTAQIFYKKCIETTGIDATWELIRWKVRHLKSSFKKANDWRKSTGAGLQESDEGTSSVEGKVLQMCPYYKQLEDIFGEKSRITNFDVVDSGDVTVIECEFNEFAQRTESPLPTQTSPVAVPKKAKDFAEKLKKNAPKSSAVHLAAFQADRTEMFKLKIEWEKEKHEKDLALNERKLKLEEEKVKAEIENRKRELDLKVLELQKDEKLKILQMEKDERLQNLEIEMKYKYQLQK